MRFLMVTTFFPPYSFGGDAIYVERLSRELVRRGHEVEVVHCVDAYEALTSERPPPSGDPSSGLTVHAVRSGVGMLSPLLTQQTGRAFFKRRTIRDLLRRRDFDVVHCHNMSLIGLDVLSLFDRVTLYTTHEHWLVCPTHVLWRYNREVCTRRTCFTCQIVWKRPPQWWRYTSLGDRYLRRVDRFLCPSRFTLAKHQEMGFRGYGENMTHLPYFVPVNREPLSAAPPHPRPYALFVGRLEKIKGVQNLLSAFRSYRGCDLVVAGDGTYGDDLRRLADDLNHVHFIGRLSPDDIRHWYRHALAVVVPSICLEVFGIVVIESFAVSTPALVTPSGALPELIHESGGGVVYRNNEELVEALERLRADRAYRDNLGARGHEAYLRLWSEDPHIERYMEIVRECGASE
jgi:glycosyltransferase involved in cell wall biosynthesis